MCQKSEFKCRKIKCLLTFVPFVQFVCASMNSFETHKYFKTKLEMNLKESWTR